MSDLNTIDIHAEIQSALPAVFARMRGELADRIAAEAQSVALDEVRKAAREWATTVLVPEVRAQFEAGKQGMLDQAAVIGKGLAEAISAALMAQATKSLDSSYNVKSICETLFKGY